MFHTQFYSGTCRARQKLAERRATTSASSGRVDARAATSRDASHIRDILTPAEAGLGGRWPRILPVDMSGQSVIDRLNAAKHSIAGQGLAKSVCKSTTEELKPPKRKHLDYLLQCTNEPNVSIPQIADLLIERMQAGNWIVTMKTLITIHNMMNHGNERFCQYLASNNCSLSLDNFMDRSHPQGYEMSTFVKKYAKYINEKAVAYRTMAFDFCKVKRGKDDGLLRTMAVEKLLKALPTLQKQVDVLLEFDATQNDLVNSVISAAHVQLFKDLIRLFACYNDGIINLLEKYFDMHKKQCKEALDLYKKFLVRMDKTSEFLKVAESVGIDRGDIPDLAKAPASLLEALEAHLAHLEGKKPAAATAAGAHSVAAATVRPSGLTDEEKRRIIEEENRELAKLKEQKARQEVKATVAAPLGHAAPASSASAESKQPAASTAAAAVMSAGAGTAVQAQHRPSEDLLSLDDVNPFKAKVQSVLAAQQTLFLQQQQVASPYGWPAPAAAVPVASMAAAPGTFGMVPAVQQNGMPRNGSFSSEPNFAAAFNGPPRSGAAAGGGSSEGMLRPTRVGAVQHSAAPGTDMFGEVMQPQNKSGQDSSKNQKFVVQGDLDSSLANLAGSLTVGPSQHKKSDFQWTPQPAEKKLTGGNNFSSVQSAPSASTWSLPPQQQPLVTAVPVAMVAPPLVQPQAAYQYPVYGMQAPYGTPIAAPMFMPMQPSVGSPFGVFSAQPQQQQPPSVQLRPQATFTRDPFGAL